MATQLVAHSASAPSWMLSARSTNQRFDVGRQLRWTGMRPARPIGQDGHAACRRRPAWWRHPLIHRAAHDLMEVNPDATKSMAGMPCGRSLYGSIPEQLADDTSFTRQLQSCGCARITASQPVSRSTSLTRSGRPTTTAVASSDKRGSRCFSTCCRRRARCGGRIRRSCLGLTGAGPRRGVATSH